MKFPTLYFKLRLYRLKLVNIVIGRCQTWVGEFNYFLSRNSDLNI